MKKMLPVAVVVYMMCMAGGGRAAPPDSARSWYVRRVHIKGASQVPVRKLKAMMESAPRLLGRTPYATQTLWEDVQRLDAFYVSRGYMHSRVAVDTVMRNPATHRVHIHLQIEEGPRTLVDSVYVGTAGGILAQDSLRRVVRTRAGDPLTASRITTDRTVLASLLSRHGLLEAQVSHTIAFQDDSLGAILGYHVREGPVIGARTIDVDGCNKVRTSLVRHEIAIDSMDIVTRQGIDRTVRRLYDTGLFTLVSVYYGDSTQQGQETLTGRDTVYRRVTVTVAERDYLSAQASLGFHTHEKVRTKGEASHDNLFSRGYRVWAGGELNFVQWKPGYMLRGGFDVPWRHRPDGMLPDMTWSEEVSYSRENEVSFTGRFTRVLSRVAVHPLPSVQVFVRHRWEEVSIDTVTAALDTLEYKNTNSIGLGGQIDRRDDMLDATRGYLLSSEVELAGLSGRRGNQFYRLQGKGAAYFRLRKKVVLAAALRAGISLPYAHTAGIPLQERFYLGGPDVMRGYAYHGMRTASDSADGAPAGGNLFVGCNLFEVRMPIVGMLHGAVFCDAGGLWYLPGLVSRTSDAVTIADEIRLNPGVGVRLKTFIGVLRADMGFAWRKRDPSSLPFAVHVGIGQAF
jgi:outer membrane protein assembly factor BamA